MRREQGEAAQVKQGFWMRTLVAVGAAGVAFATAGTASADAAGDGVLGQVDAALNRYKTLQLKYDMLNQEPGKDPNTMEVLVRMKAGGKQLTELLGPADVKGTKVLVLSDSQMYVYLPAFGKVRRVASHVKNQGFLGTTFSQTDMALSRYGGYYSASIGSEDGGSWTLVLTPKAGVDNAPYPKIQMTVDKGKQLPTTIEYYNDAGTKVKTETRANYQCDAASNVCEPGEQKMVDHSKGDHWSKLVLKAYKVNSELSDDLFSKRSLQE